ncbi:MAG: hypothetical protein V3V00_07010 [Saprospiraceae bacterium]
MKIELKKEIRGTCLENIDKTFFEYKVPEGYFDNLSQRALAEAENPSNVNKVVRLIRYSSWMGITAAVVFLIASLCYFNIQISSENIFENISGEEIMEYASMEISLTDLDMAMLLEEELSGFVNISSEAIDQYIDDHTDLIELEKILEFQE